MNTCTVCNEQSNDGVQCGRCKKFLDFGCANISESGWRKLGADRRAQWKCPKCRISSPAVTNPEPAASLDVILSEIRDMKRQLLSLPTLVDNIRSIKDELTELKSTCDSSSEKLDEFSTRLVQLETKVSQFELLQETVTSLQADLVKTKHELSAHDQRSRLNNIEIKGMPIKKDENLFSIVEAISRKINYSCPKTQINYISRVPVHNSNEKLIIVSFLNRYIKEDFIAAARADNNISTSDIGFQGDPLRIYVNDHLGMESKKLLNKVKIAAKEKHFEFVWGSMAKFMSVKMLTAKLL